MGKNKRNEIDKKSKYFYFICELFSSSVKTLNSAVLSPIFMTSSAKKDLIAEQIP